MQLLAGADHIAQCSRRVVTCRIGNHLQRDVGHEDALDTVFDQRRQQQCRVASLRLRQQNQGAAAGQGREDLLEVDVEGQRRKLEGPRRLSQPGVPCMPMNQMPQGHGTHRNTLGPTGGARSEEHITQIGCRCMRHFPRWCGMLQRREFTDGSAQLGQRTRLAQHHARRGVLQHRLQTVGRVVQIQRHVAETRVYRRENRNDGVDGPDRCDAYAITRHEALVSQLDRKRCGSSQQFSVAELLFRCLQRAGLRKLLRCFAQPMRQKRWGRRSVAIRVGIGLNHWYQSRRGESVDREAHATSSQLAERTVRSVLFLSSGLPRHQYPLGQRSQRRGVANAFVMFSALAFTRCTCALRPVLKHCVEKHDAHRPCCA